MRVVQKLNEINYAFKDIGMQPNIWDHLVQTIDRLLAPDCLVTINLVTCHLRAELTRASLYRFMATWLSEGLWSLQIEDIRVVAVDVNGDTVQCTIRSYMDRGLTQVSALFILTP
jgi:hypothetical protein